MITVTLDYQAVAKKYGKQAEDILQRSVDALGEFALDRIRQKSSEKLGIETWQEFSKSIKTTRDKLSVTISIEDPRMASLEEGYSSFDIKPGLLHGAKVKHGANGPYQDVPLQHKTTKRGQGSYIASAAMRNSVNKALQRAKSTGTKTRFGKLTGAASRMSGMQITADKGAQTFRRVSQNSTPDSWVHPGFEGLEVFEATLREVEAIKDRVISDAAKALT
jgi:hypothetical protein